PRGAVSPSWVETGPRCLPRPGATCPPSAVGAWCVMASFIEKNSPRKTELSYSRASLTGTGPPGSRRPRGPPLLRYKPFQGRLLQRNGPRHGRRLGGRRGAVRTGRGVRFGVRVGGGVRGVAAVPPGPVLRRRRRYPRHPARHVPRGVRQAQYPVLGPPA